MTCLKLGRDHVQEAPRAKGRDAASRQSPARLRPCLAAIAAVTLMLPAPSFAQPQAPAGPYVQLGLGALILQDNDYSAAGRTLSGSYDVGPYGTLALGYRISPNFRVEFEIGGGVTEYSIAGSSSSDSFGILAGFAAGYVDLPVGSAVVPYLGLGIGLVGYPGRDLGGSTGLAAFGELGLSIPLGGGLDLVPGVRYTWFDAGSDYANADAGWLPKVAFRYAF